MLINAQSFHLRFLCVDIEPSENKDCYAVLDSYVQKLSFLNRTMACYTNSCRIGLYHGSDLFRRETLDGCSSMSHISGHRCPSSFVSVDVFNRLTLKPTQYKSVDQASRTHEELKSMYQ